MALPPDANAEVFMREVDDEVRRDQLTAFWTRWGKLLIAAIVVGLALFAAYLFWQNRQEEAAGVQGEELQAAYDSVAAGDYAKAEAPLKQLAAEGGPSYQALAKYTQADLLLQKNDPKGAAAKFAEVARDDSIAKPFRDLALVRQTAIEFDSLQPQVVVERMRPLAVPGNPWLGSAGEMMAVAQIRMGQTQQAGQLFARIAEDEGVPASLRQRAVQMASAMGVEAALPSAAAATVRKVQP
ncbi:tetratricopeptide repeat protein [Sphingomonas abaci]|uniref:Ancillary SecYEG translocon subunit n=1 Tax=Sphingomonas abaci TaxID=237611 RepID=A0A7W7F0Q2_9SPHN|nr:tetratricopeptide repeat protein [Sphingomonas abaci]MBB4618575.1 hypothetical protein [Sphingomonas abaci]